MKPKFKHKQLKFNEGDLIYSIGDEAKNVYLIHSGHISIRSKHGLELGNLGPGEIFGEVGRVINSPRTVTAKAKTDCVVYEIDWANLQKKLDEADPVLVAITRGLSFKNWRCK